MVIRLAEAKGPIRIVVESTGLRVFGEGEWKVRQHGAGKRRIWRKVHLAADPNTHEIVATLPTKKSVRDTAAVEPLLEQIPEQIKSFRADGVYDAHDGYDRLANRNIDPIIPPRSNAVPTKGDSEADLSSRDCSIHAVKNVGLKFWKPANRLSVERYPQIFGPRQNSPSLFSAMVGRRCFLKDSSRKHCSTITG